MRPTSMDQGDPSGFDAFVADHETALRRAFVARYGMDAGEEALSDALAYAWEHWPKVSQMSNPAGYLYRVGQSAVRHLRRRPVVLPAVDVAELPDVQPGLPAALARLTRRQRTAVLLVHGYGYSVRETAQLVGISESSIQNHLRRGMAKLRRDLEAM